MNEAPNHALPFRRALLRRAQDLEQAKRAETEGPELAEGQRTAPVCHAGCSHRLRPQPPTVVRLSAIHGFVAANFPPFEILHRWMIAIALVSSTCGAIAQEITRPDKIIVDFSASGQARHEIDLQANGSYTVRTTSTDLGNTMQTSRLTEKSLTAENLKPLLAYCNSRKVRRTFANAKNGPVAARYSLLITIWQNKYSLQLICCGVSQGYPTAERKLIAITTELLSKVDRHLYEPPRWQDVRVGLEPENIDTAGLHDLLLALLKLEDLERRIVPLKIYFLGKPSENKPIKIPATDRPMSEILHEIGDSLGLSFGIYRDIAVFGTREELYRFDASIALQPATHWGCAYVSIPTMVIIGAQLNEMTDFVNHKLAEHRRSVDEFFDHKPDEHNNEQLECLSHADREIYCAGNSIPVGDIISVIAADLGEPVSKVFAEKHSDP